MGIPILAYHLVSDRFEIGIARTTKKQFSRQMQWLAARGFATVTLHQALERDELNPSQKYIAITFDDAYATLDFVAEEMGKYGFIGTCFAISEFIGKQNTWDYQFFHRKLKHADAGMLKVLSQSGWEVGSHSKTHAYLPALSSSALDEELKHSKATIESLLGTQVRSISYPFGRANPRVCQAAQRAGYINGAGLGVSMSHGSQCGRMCVPRVGIYLFDWPGMFRRKVSGDAKRYNRFLYAQQCISAFSYGTVLLQAVRRKRQYSVEMTT